MNALFPPAPERAALDAALTDLLAAARERVTAGPVVPTLDMDAFRRDLASFDFTAPRALRDTINWTAAQLERGLVHITHPRYFGLFNPPATFPAQCADRISAVFNPQLATATTSPAAVAIEDHVIRAVASRLGLPGGSAGHFTTGGAEANLTALVLALTRAHPAFAQDGARAFSGQPVFYVSADCHLAWIKIAHMTGIGRNAVRLIATDGGGRMCIDALRAAIRVDRDAGCVPVMLVATAGTTNAGMIDPMAACADEAAVAGAWFHVDAAWGGAVVASDAHRDVLRGIEAADSVTVDAHKWFATTMGSGMFLTRWTGLLPAAFQVATTYMPSAAAQDPYVTSVQWSRRFIGLRLFLSLATAGWQGYGAHVEHALDLAALLRQRLAEVGWNVVNDSPLGVVCARPPDPAADVSALVKRVLASGQAWVSAARFEGQAVVRACITSGETTEADIDVLVRALTEAANLD